MLIKVEVYECDHRRRQLTNFKVAERAQDIFDTWKGKFLESFKGTDRQAMQSKCEDLRPKTETLDFDLPNKILYPDGKLLPWYLDRT